MRAIDELRGMYVSSPYWIKRVASPLLSIVPFGFLYGKTYSQASRMIGYSKDNPQFVAEYQEKTLASIIEPCVNLNDYYQRIFEGVYDGGSDWKSNCVAGLKKLPILNKEEVRRNIDKYLVRPRSELDLVSTSGSSGQPLSFYLDRDRGPKEIAFIHQVWAQVGYRASKHRRAVLRGFSFPNVEEKPWEYDPALNELRLSASQMLPETMKLYLELIKRYDIDFLHGYPSAITLLSNFAISINWEKPASLIGVFPISEALFDYQRVIILKAFPDIKILSFYGQSEKVAFAGELADFPDIFEFEPLYGIVELVDDQGRPVLGKGERGRIVSTGLLTKGMPLFRYDTGDTAELVELGSEDNCYRMRVRKIRSRRALEYVVGYKGEKFYFTAILPHTRTFEKIQQFQLYQEVPGEVTVKVVPYFGQTEKEIRAFVDEIQSKAGKMVKFSLETVKFLPPNPRGKRHCIEQKLIF